MRWRDFFAAGHGVRVCGAVAMLIGSSWLVFWFTGLAARWGAEGVNTVKTNMALCQVLAGAALLLLAAPAPDKPRRRVGVAAAAAVVFLIGTLTLSQHLFGYNLGIDQLLASEPPGVVATVSPNRIGPPGSASLMLLGAGLLLLASRRSNLAPWFGLGVCVVILVPAVGFLYGIVQFYGVPRLTGIAWSTVVALVSLGVGLVLACPASGPAAQFFRADAGGVLLRRLWPAVVIIPLLLGLLKVLGRKHNLFDTAVGTGMLMIALVVVFSALLWLSAAHLSRAAVAQAKAEAELRASQERFELVVRGSGVGLWDWNISADKVYYSPRWKELFGYAAHEIGESVEDWVRLLHPEEREAVLKVQEDFLAGTGSTLTAEYRLRHKDGSFRWIDAHGVVVRDAQGKALRLVGSHGDVTARKRAEEALRESESRAKVAQAVQAERQRFYDVLNLLPAYVVLLTPDYHVAFANRFFEERFGKSHGRRCFEYLFNRTEPCAVCGTYTVLKTNAPHNWEWVGPDGRDYEIHDFPFTDADGSRLIMETGIDVTARKQAETSLKEANARLEERTAKLQELVGELEHFSYTITHDMRAPLRAIKGYGEIMSLICGECEKQEPKEFLRRMSTSADRMDALIRDALNFSRAVREELPLEEVDTGALLRGMLDSYPEFQASKARITLEGTLPAVLGNQAGLTQCFSNLLGNAVKFVKPGQVPEVRVRAEERGEWVRIWVEDNGIGISREMLPKVFEMFSRANPGYEGTGIGLALVRKVAQRMGGKAGVESEPGKGSRFWVELRAARN